MSGETEDSVSGWTTDTLREHIDRQLADLHSMLDERYATQTKALDAAFKAAEQAVATALTSAEKAVAKAEVASDKRFESVNEFRQQLADQTASFPTRIEMSTRMDGLADQVSHNATRIGGLELRLTSRLDTAAGSTSGAAESRTERRLDNGQVMTALSVLFGAVILALAVYAAFHK